MWYIDTVNIETTWLSQSKTLEMRSSPPKKKNRDGQLNIRPFRFFSDYNHCVHFPKRSKQSSLYFSQRSLRSMPVSVHLICCLCVCIIPLILFVRSLRAPGPSAKQHVRARLCVMSHASLFNQHWPSFHAPDLVEGPPCQLLCRLEEFITV